MASCCCPSLDYWFFSPGKLEVGRQHIIEGSGCRWNAPKANSKREEVWVQRVFGVQQSPGEREKRLAEGDVEM